MRRGWTIALMSVSLGASALALAGCRGKPADTGKAAAAAEVLPGSASDAMIAYDTLRSQPPLAVASASIDAGAGRAADTGVDGDADPDPLASEAVSAPVPTPEPAAAPAASAATAP